MKSFHLSKELERFLVKNLLSTFLGEEGCFRIEEEAGVCTGELEVCTEGASKSSS